MIIDEKINLRSKYITTYTLNYIIFTDEYPENDIIEDISTAAGRNSSKFGDVNRDGYMYTTSMQNLDVKVSTQGLYVRNSLKFLSGTISGSKLLFFMELGFGINGIYGKTILDLTNYSLVDRNNSIKKLCDCIYQNIKNYKLVPRKFRLEKELEVSSTPYIQYCMNLIKNQRPLINKIAMFTRDIKNRFEK